MENEPNAITYYDVVLHLQHAAGLAKTTRFSLSVMDIGSGIEEAILHDPEATSANSAVIVLDPSGSNSAAAEDGRRPFYYVRTVGELACVGTYLIENADGWVEETDPDDMLPSY